MITTHEQFIIQQVTEVVTTHAQYVSHVMEVLQRCCAGYGGVTQVLRSSFFLTELPYSGSLLRVILIQIDMEIRNTA